MTEKDLVEIIRRQSEQIDGLIAENKALKAHIARLKSVSTGWNGRNASAPFSRERSQVTGTAPW